MLYVLYHNTIHFRAQMSATAPCTRNQYTAVTRSRNLHLPSLHKLSFHAPFHKDPTDRLRAPRHEQQTPRSGQTFPPTATTLGEKKKRASRPDKQGCKTSHLHIFISSLLLSLFPHHCTFWTHSFHLLQLTPWQCRRYSLRAYKGPLRAQHKGMRSR